MSDSYLKHALQHEFFRWPGLRRRAFDLPVCRKCERVALRDRGWREARIVRCPWCGYNGPGGPPLKLHWRELRFGTGGQWDGTDHTVEEAS